MGKGINKNVFYSCFILNWGYYDLKNKNKNGNKSIYFLIHHKISNFLQLNGIFIQTISTKFGFYYYFFSFNLIFVAIVTVIYLRNTTLSVTLNVIGLN